MLKYVKNFVRDEEGASAVEYALIAGLIAVIIVGAFTLFGTNFTGLFNYIAGLIAPPA